MNGESEKDDALFVNLILIFQGAAMQQMGKIINPLTGKVDKNLEQARFSIDTLAMLRGKTQGNLSSDLEMLLDSTLLQLRMNYVEEAAAEEKSVKERGEDKPSKEMATGARGAEERNRVRESETEKASPEKGTEDRIDGDRARTDEVNARKSNGRIFGEESSGKDVTGAVIRDRNAEREAVIENAVSGDAAGPHGVPQPKRPKGKGTGHRTVKGK
ncbi:MAG: DUF1844 domain-containing protein [Candidatus Eisenbacteria bacterium]